MSRRISSGWSDDVALFVRFSCFRRTSSTSASSSRLLLGLVEPAELGLAEAPPVVAANDRVIDALPVRLDGEEHADPALVGGPVEGVLGRGDAFGQEAVRTRGRADDQSGDASGRGTGA